MASLTAGLIAFLPAQGATAQASAWALSATHTVARSGATLLVDGTPVTLDAASSGLRLQTAMGLLVQATVCGGIAAVMRTTPNHNTARLAP